MPFEIVEAATRPSGAENEDRVGYEGPLFWVIDGATDAIEAPLTNAPSDALWFAAELDRAFRRHADTMMTNLVELFALITPGLAESFASAARREPAGRHEHPSASAMIVRESPAGLEWMSIGDCTLLTRSPKGFLRFGTDADDAGDKALAAVIRSIHAKQADPGTDAARAEMSLRIRAGRRAMNLPEGYGVWSITEPPSQFVRQGRIDLPPGNRVLLATDGLLRLVDVFAAMSAETLYDRACSSGIAPLIDEVRALEEADAMTTDYPRAKVSDDATGLLVQRN